MKKNKNEDLLRYEALKAEVTYHKYMYYELNNADITDQAYDELEKRFDFLARKVSLPGSWVGWREEDLPRA